MIVYHGSHLIVQKPDICYSKSTLDFGSGFYVTPDINQAELWAKRKSAGHYQKSDIIKQVIRFA